jgi:hypothetical protein
LSITANMPDRNGSPIFIVGCPRSGTGLIRNLLRSHPRLTFPGESHFIPGFFRAYGNPGSGREASELAERILKLEWIKSWGLALDPSQFAYCRSYAEIVAGIYTEWARKENKVRWGDKTPQYVAEIPTLLEVFPNSKIIHIIRDGRDVALSWLRVNFGPENVFTAASDWKRFVEAGRSYGSSAQPGTYMEIFYEQLVEEPRESLERVCAFLDEPFSDDIVKPNPLERNFREPKFGKRSPTYASQTEIVGTNPGKWREKMSGRDRVIFESVAGDLLASLGYQTEGITRKITKREQLFWKTHHLFLWSLARLDAGEKGKWLKTDLFLRWTNIRGRYRRRRRAPVKTTH